MVFEAATGRLVNAFQLVNGKLAKLAAERLEKPAIEKYADELAASASPKYRELAKQLREQNKAYVSPEK